MTVAHVPELQVTSAVKKFGGVTAVNDLSFSVTAENIVGIIGPNGSGKSTLCNLMTGVAPATSGTVLLGGVDITRKRPDQIFRLGLSRTFQNTRLFGQLTVEDNMLLAARGRSLGMSDAREQLEFVGLTKLKDAKAAGLSYGDQKLLELAMGLVGDSGVVVLDEPLAGVHERVVDRIYEVIKARSASTRFLIVEHNVAFMMQICQRIIVIDQGRLIADGVPAVVRKNPAVVQAYFGEE